MVNRREIGRASLAAAATVLLASVVSAQQTFVYPKNGQSADQQARDQAACAEWAKSQSGVNPAVQPTPDRAARRHGTVGGAARGAAAGAAVGAIAGDAGKGAAAGSAVGAAAGRRRSKQQEQAAQGAQRDADQRAYAACMESRGYTVR